MKPQSTAGAIPHDHLLYRLQPEIPDEEAKLGLGACLASLLQVGACLGACGILHWAMT